MGKLLLFRYVVLRFDWVDCLTGFVVYCGLFNLWSAWNLLWLLLLVEAT